MIIGIWFMLCMILAIVLTLIYINQLEDEISMGDLCYVLFFVLLLYGAGCFYMVKNGLLVM